MVIFVFDGIGNIVGKGENTHRTAHQKGVRESGETDSNYQNRQEELAGEPKFCQGFLNMEVGKHVCLENNPKMLQQTLNPVKNHQCISQAVDDKNLKAIKQKPNVIETRSAWKK